MSLPLYTSYSEETQTLIEEFLENTFGWDEDELVDFIEEHGEEKFKLYFEELSDKGIEECEKNNYTALSVEAFEELMTL